MRRSASIRCLLAGVMGAAVLVAAAARAATVSTDQEDYPPAATAHITGSGFQAGEAVRLQVLHADGTPSTGAAHDPWTVTADAGGNISSSWFVCTDDCVNSILELTATGLSSAAVAKARFTDGSTGLLRLVNVTAANGGCVFGPTGPGTQHWDVEAGKSYTLTFSFSSRTSFDSCLGSSLPATIAMRIQGFGIPFTATRSGNSATYTATVTIPSTACRTTPIGYCAGFVRRADGNFHQAHLRVSIFGANCTNPVERQCCSGGPTIACPSNINTDTDSGRCDAVVTFTPRATAACPDVTVNVVCVPPSGSVFHAGTTTVTCTARDGAGQSVSCTFLVTVNDRQPPIISCPADRVFECLATPTFDQPSATDNCTNVTVRIVSTVTNTAGFCGNTFSITRTWEAVDAAGNTARCSQTLTVVDTTAPVITCAPDRVVECGPLGGFTRPTAIDACDGTNVVIAIVSTVTNRLCGNTFSATRTWTATDRCGNQSRCSQTITVVDTTPPTITCGPDRTVECGTPWSFTRPTALDLCDGTNVTVRISSTVTNGLCGSTFSATRTWTATDGCGNQASCSQTITVVDTIPPVLIGVPPNASYMRLPDVPPPAAVTAIDACDSTPVVTRVSFTNDTCPIIIVHCWTATDACGNSATACQTNTVACPPRICVTKEIACLLPNENCSAFGKTATGVKGDAQAPAFCYRITVNNCGRTPLRNLSVTDDQLGDLTSIFFPDPAAELPVGASVTRYFKMAWANDTTNTVTTSGQGVSNGQIVQATDYAVARVLVAGIACSEIVRSPDDIDGHPFDNNVQLPRDRQAHLVQFLLIVVNTGEADLINVTATTTGLGVLGCGATAPFNLPAGASVTNVLCQANLSCDQVPLVDTASVVAAVDTASGACAYDLQGIAVHVNSQCGAVVTCQIGACRVTGGGRQESIQTYPTVRYVTHGGQVGAPVGNATAFDPDSACIHGNWEHVRHVQGNTTGNFHARSFDSLMCACLGCPNGAGVKVGDLCNPDDRVCGPSPRKAPANKICFSGVGDYTMTSGSRLARSVLFRVDIEDRGEPGNNGSPSNDPPDRYRIRIWVLTAAELARLNTAGDRLLDFRRAIACTDGSTATQDGAPGALGSAVFGVRAPDVDDGGELDHGNHQIHPMIKDCP